MFKLMNWNTIDYFEEKEDCLDACLTATLEVYKQDVAALANDIYTEGHFVACKCGYIDEVEGDGVYTREELLEILWDFASCMWDWNEFAKRKDLPYVREVDEIEEAPQAGKHQIMFVNQLEIIDD